MWTGFFSLLFRFWPDLPYPLYLISNHLSFPDRRVTALCVGNGSAWSETVARGLERLSSRFVLLFLEDFFLTDPVNTAYVQRLHAVMVAKSAAYLRLVPRPPPDSLCPETPEIGVIAKCAPYRASLQISFWDRLLLLGLLRREESAWDFELKGSRRPDSMSEPFLSVSKSGSAISYTHVLFRGKLLPEAIRQFTPLGIVFDQSNRPVESELYLRWYRSAIRRHLGRAWRFATRRSF